ncbi:MAG: hypothetical protein LC792_07425 [Actinobacteria bacterium]|nr:hypothetical protein [Actinomycetota bacterium]
MVRSARDEADPARLSVDDCGVERHRLPWPEALRSLVTVVDDDEPLRDDSVRPRALEPGAVERLCKPFGETDLLGALDAALQ